MLITNNNNNNKQQTSLQPSSKTTKHEQRKWHNDSSSHNAPEQEARHVLPARVGWLHDGLWQAGGMLLLALRGNTAGLGASNLPQHYER
jgi:hypothetical protein